MSDQTKQVKPNEGDDKNSDFVDEKEAIKRAQQNLNEYLQSPKKKQRKFVVFALSPHFDSDLARELEQFVANTYGRKYVMSYPRNLADLRRQFPRNIMLLIIDDEFGDLKEIAETVGELKKKKHATITPVLFLTRNPAALIETYHSALHAYQETDEYLTYPKMEASQICARIRQGIESGNRRRSRRYKVDIPITYFSLGREETHKGRILDLSVHGALLKSDDGSIFRAGDQIRINIPIAHVLPPENGEFLKISTRVRRVFIAGDMAGLSFEHLSESQVLTLASFVTTFVNRVVARHKSISQRTNPAKNTST